MSDHQDAKRRKLRLEREAANRKSLAEATAKLVKSRTEGALHKVAEWTAKPLVRKAGAY